MSYHWTIPLVAAAACLFLGGVVYRSGPRSSLSQVFTFLAITLVFWNLNFVVLYAIADRAQAFEIARTMRVGSMFVPPAIFHLSIAIRSRNSRALMWCLVADYIVAIVLVCLNARDLVVSDIHSYAWGYYSVGTRIYNIYTVFVIANFIGATTLMMREFWLSHDPRIRLQLKFWLLGLLISLPLGLTNLLPAYGIAFYPLGNLGSAVWAAIVAYAIVRHRLMDIDVFVTKGIAYAGGALVVLGPAFAILLMMERLAFGGVHYDFSLGALGLLFLVGLVFPALRARVEVGLARSLFREKYQSRSALTELAHSIVRILDRDKLIGQLCDTLNDVFHLDHIALFLMDASRAQFQLQRAIGAQPPIANYGAEHPLMRWLTARAEPVLREEALSESPGRPSGAVGMAFRSNAWEVVVPLVNGRLLIGFIALGRKRNLQAFGAGDLDILSNVGAEASIAFENARLYAELRQSQDIITRAGRLSALGTLAAGIAHEIRNPLVSIQTFFQLAPQRLDDEEFMTSFLRLAEAEVERISNLISELLTFAKSPTASIRELDLDDVVDRTVTLIAPQARTQNVELRRANPVGLPPVLADPDQIMQVLLNIALNAVQATPPGGVVSIETRQIDIETGPFCQVEVRDTGPGIARENREAIFNPFFTTKDKGTGLGLPIAHRIVAECGGFIVLESVEGKGSRFFVNFPPAGRVVSGVDVKREGAVQGE